jgi:acyl carrier protein
LSDPKNRSLEEIKQELKRLLIENLALEGKKPEDIRDDMDLFGDGGVGLDSLDGVEVVVILHRNFGLDTKQMQKSREMFRSINTMAPYVLAHAVK